MKFQFYLQNLENEMLKYGNNISKVMEIQEIIDKNKKKEDKLFERIRTIKYKLKKARKSFFI